MSKKVNKLDNNKTTYNQKFHEYETNRIETLLHLDNVISKTDWKPNREGLSLLDADKLINEALKEKTI